MPEIITLLSLANRAVMEMNSHSEHAHEVLRDEASSCCVWASTPLHSAGERYVALFNLGSQAQLVQVTYFGDESRRRDQCHGHVDRDAFPGRQWSHRAHGSADGVVLLRLHSG